MNRIYRNVHAICPSAGLDGVMDLAIEGGKIAAIGERLTGGGEEVDCHGLHLFPGLVDLDCQLGEPGLEERETLQSGGSAAAAGGFTTLLVNPKTRPVLDDPALVRELANRAPGQTDVEILPIGALTKGLGGQELAEMGLMAQAGAVAFSNAEVQVPNTATLRFALLYARPFGVPVMVRAGDASLEEYGSMHEGDVSTAIGLRGLPSAAEEIGVARLIALSRGTGAPVHISGVTTRKAVDQIRAAKAEGVQVTASTTAHHLLLNDTAVRDSVYSTSMRLLPPLRSEADRLALCTGVRDQTIDAVVSQHTPWTRVEKEVEFELAQPGATGVQTAFNETLEALDGDYCAALRALSSGPNRLLGRQSGLTVGASADFFLWDAEAEWSLDHHSNQSLCQNSPVWERGFRGKVVSTYRKGLKIEVG